MWSVTAWASRGKSFVLRKCVAGLRLRTELAPGNVQVRHGDVVDGDDDVAVDDDGGADVGDVDDVCDVANIVVAAIDNHVGDADEGDRNDVHVAVSDDGGTSTPTSPSTGTTRHRRSRPWRDSGEHHGKCRNAHPQDESFFLLGPEKTASRRPSTYKNKAKAGPDHFAQSRRWF